jgi:hypothetical protein
MGGNTMVPVSPVVPYPGSGSTPAKLVPVKIVKIVDTPKYIRVLSRSAMPAVLKKIADGSSA